MNIDQSTFPCFGWTAHKGGRQLVHLTKETRTGYRGKRWLGSRWGAMTTIKNLISFTSDEIGERVSGGSDFRDYRGDAVIDGVTPTAGMFVINKARRRCYGVIKTVTHDGGVVWTGPYGADTESYASTLHHGGYSYVTTPPTGYAVLTENGWV